MYENNQYVLNFMELLKYLTENLHIVPEDEEMISSFNEKKIQCHYTFKMLTFSIVVIDTLWISYKM
jgi:hypothetical protein